MAASVEMEFDPAKHYQPMPAGKVCYFDYLGMFRFFSDGSVEPLDSDMHFEWDPTSNYPRFCSGMCAYTVHRIIGDTLWPHQTRPKQLKFIDHIDGNCQNNSWDNLRPVTVSMNNINRRSKKRPIRGWVFEDENMLAKINACLAKKKKPVYRKTSEARNKYVAQFTNQGVRHEIGCFDTPDAAHKAYLAGREQFIKDELRRIWNEAHN